jgi:protein-tyrosine phosphatase
MIKVLFVCLGNICRSPTAEGVFRELVISNGLEEQFIIDSAGTSSYHIGSAPDLRSQQEAKRHQVDISKQRARAVEEHDFEIYDYILAMDKHNLETLLDLCPKEYRYKVKLMLDFHPDPNWQEVPDPYYSTDGFSLVFSLLQESAVHLLRKICHENNISL